MLTRITVQGFKSLQDVEIELGQVNVFVGANGSGKSNLLEAVGLLGAAASRQVDDQALLRRGVRPGTSSLYQSSFKGLEILGKIALRATWYAEKDSFEYRVEFTDMTDVRHQPWWYDGKLSVNGQEIDLRLFDYLYDDPKEPQVARDFFIALKDYAIFAPNTPALRGVEPDITQRSPVGLAGGQLAEAVAELQDVEKDTFGTLDLDELLELLDWVDKIAVTSPSREIISPSVPTVRNIIQFTDRWMHEERNRLSAYDASEGALYVLFALVLALHPWSPRLFAIDNFDQAMHPRLARATMRLFCQQILKASPERQALLTTHNPLVLDGLDLRDDRIRLFAVERNSRGATQVHRVQVSDEVLQATQEGLSLSNLWVMGRLGGVPDLF